MRLDKILEADARISSKLLHKESKGLWHSISVFFAHSGDSWFWFAALILIWFFGNDAWHNRSAFLSVGLAILAVLVLLMKFTIKRRRPEGEWGNIYRATDPHSFPSGHAARAAALAVMAFGVGPFWFAVSLALWAPLVGIARVRLGVHFLSDVIVGWLIGIMTGIIALATLPLIQTLVPFIFR
ncbi:MAG: phosphatase PAP2 family protein [Anaerolineaceae bacterium]|nr:phosphatase PAP2 family protein [Anaerolineaceae bacterium]